MAQIRDAVTSELLGDGTPVQVAAIGERIGFAEVIFDDVGESFDPVEVLRVHRENVASLEELARDRSVKGVGVTAKNVEELVGPVRDAVELGLAPAEAALEAARERVG